MTQSLLVKMARVKAPSIYATHAAKVMRELRAQIAELKFKFDSEKDEDKKSKLYNEALVLKRDLAEYEKYEPKRT